MSEGDGKGTEQIRFFVGPMDLRRISADQMALLQDCKNNLEALAVLGVLAPGENGAVPSIETWTAEVSMGPRC